MVHKLICALAVICFMMSLSHVTFYVIARNLNYGYLWSLFQLLIVFVWGFGGWFLLMIDDIFFYKMYRLRGLIK